MWARGVLPEPRPGLLLENKVLGGPTARQDALMREIFPFG